MVESLFGDHLLKITTNKECLSGLMQILNDAESSYSSFLHHFLSALGDQLSKCPLMSFCVDT